MASSDRAGYGEAFKLTLISDDPDLAAAADAAGVDRIGLDIERLGKTARQVDHQGARISPHRLEDFARISPRIRRAQLFCRLDPLHAETGAQIEQALDLGARALMLPFFTRVEEAETFARLVDGRAWTMLLVETAAAAWRIEAVARVAGVDEIMIGLNDLAWDSRVKARFELLASPLMTALGAAVRDAGLPLSIGGLGRWEDSGLPTPPDLLYAQYPRLGASGAWLARSFHAGLGPEGLNREVAAARRRLDHWAQQGPEALEAARLRLSRRRPG